MWGSTGGSGVAVTALQFLERDHFAPLALQVLEAPLAVSLVGSLLLVLEPARPRSRSSSSVIAQYGRL